MRSPGQLHHRLDQFGVGVREVALCDSTASPTQALSHALFSAAFDKTLGKRSRSDIPLIESTISKHEQQGTLAPATMGEKATVLAKNFNRAMTTPPSEMTATSVVPPPISTIMLPAASMTGSRPPIAAAIGSSIRKTRRAPAASADSWIARRSTAVEPDGTQTMTADIAMSGFKLTGLAAGSASGNSVRYEQVLLLTGGTMTGQIIMEGFLNIRLRPWLRRLVTRAIALVPAVVVLSVVKSSQASIVGDVFRQVLLLVMLLKVKAAE